MDKSQILDSEVQAFIIENDNADLPKLMLQREKYAPWPVEEIVNQIACRRKAKKKLPSWYNASRILYPNPVAIEQSSSEIAAEYKAAIFSGSLVLDLTSGFGVDSYYLSKKFNKVTSIEENKNLAEISKHNFEALQQNNITVLSTTAELFIKQNNQQFDLVCIDPDRRPGSNRVTGFEESRPNILNLLPELQKITDNILIKASPMLDITKGINQLQWVNKVIVLAIENEVKELLFLLGKAKSTTKEVSCVNLLRTGAQVFNLVYSDDIQEKSSLSILGTYLYEPNVAIMKAGRFKKLSEQYNVAKLNSNTHLFTSNALSTDFPGRKFIVSGTANYRKKQVLPLLKERKANIAVRNFIDTPEQIKKKLRLEDGGDQYLFGYRDLSNRLRIAVCKQL